MYQWRPIYRQIYVGVGDADGVVTGAVAVGINGADASANATDTNMVIFTRASVESPVDCSGLPILACNLKLSIVINII